MENECLLKEIDKIINMANEEVLNEIYDKVSNKIIKIYSIEDKQKRLEYIKNNTNGLNGINIENVKQLETDYWNNVYTLLKNGDLYENGQIADIDIKSIYYLDGLNLYVITNDNKIIPLNREKEGWTNLDYYLNNKNCSYKKIIIDTLYITALTKEGRVIGTHSNPAGLGIVPENFLDVEDIKLVEIGENITMPFIIKNNKEIQLYID